MIEETDLIFSLFSEDKNGSSNSVLRGEVLSGPADDGAGEGHPGGEEEGPGGGPAGEVRHVGVSGGHERRSENLETAAGDREEVSSKIAIKIQTSFR